VCAHWIEKARTLEARRGNTRQSNRMGGNTQEVGVEDLCDGGVSSGKRSKDTDDDEASKREARVPRSSEIDREAHHSAKVWNSPGVHHGTQEVFVAGPSKAEQGVWRLVVRMQRVEGAEHQEEMSIKCVYAPEGQGGRHVVPRSSDRVP